MSSVQATYNNAELALSAYAFLTPGDTASESNLARRPTERDSGITCRDDCGGEMDIL